MANSPTSARTTTAGCARNIRPSPAQPAQARDVVRTEPDEVDPVRDLSVGEPFYPHDLAVGGQRAVRQRHGHPHPFPLAELLRHHRAHALHARIDGRSGYFLQRAFDTDDLDAGIPQRDTGTPARGDSD